MGLAAKRIAVFVEMKSESKRPAWMEVHDHGMDLRFFDRDTGRRIPPKYIRGWELDRSIEAA